MNCPKCGNQLSFVSTKCNECGEDLKMYKKIVSTSNRFYNEGLRKAKVRDLKSGAILLLQKSLQLDKTNKDARNLLGLIYYEMGETVTALSEWVLSKHFHDQNNDADIYMDAIQANPARLHSINQTIKKYNYALQQAKQGSIDLAIIQLKKVINLNPKYICAYQLLALLYIQEGEKVKAVSNLRKAQKIDLNNTTTLRYLRELDAPLEGEKKETVRKEGQEALKEEMKTSNVIKKEESKYFSPLGEYKEEKNGWYSFLNIIIGIVIGVCVVFFLVVPNIQQSLTQKYNDSVRIENEKQASAEAKLTTSESEKGQLEEDITALKQEIKQLKSDQFDEKTLNNFLTAVKTYIDGDKETSAEKLLAIDVNKLELKSAKNVYNAIKDATFNDISNGLYAEGMSHCNRGRYDDAITSLQKALKYNKDNVDAIFYLGKSYEKKGDHKKAATYYNKIINKYKDSNRANEAKTRLDNLNLE